MRAIDFRMILPLKMIFLEKNFVCGKGPDLRRRVVAIFGVRKVSPGEKSLYLPQMSANSSFYFIQGVFPGGEAIPDGIGPKKIFPCPLYPRICPIPGFLAYMASADHFAIIPAKKAPTI
jgi:hypothetical protein